MREGQAFGVERRPLEHDVLERCRRAIGLLDRPDIAEPEDLRASISRIDRERVPEAREMSSDLMKPARPGSGFDLRESSPALAGARTGSSDR